MPSRRRPREVATRTSPTAAALRRFEAGYHNGSLANVGILGAVNGILVEWGALSDEAW